MTRALFASTLLAAALTLQSSETRAADGNPQQLRDAVVSAYGDNFRADQFASYVVRVFQSFDTNRDGIERAEIDLVAQRLKAEIRAQIVGQYLQYDLDGDFEITSDEIIAKLLPERGETAEGLESDAIKHRYQVEISRVMRDDKNGDGRISLDELKSVNLETERRSGRRSLKQIDLAEELLKFDQDGDGKLTQIEAFAAIAQAFSGVDLKSLERVRDKVRDNDGSGTVNAACRAPRAPADAEVVLLGVHEGGSLSTSSLIGQDLPTSAGTIVIEPGTRPLMVLITSSKPVVWQFEGDTKRIAHLVVGSWQTENLDGKIVAGVVGVPKDRVTFVPSHRCLGMFSDASSQSKVAMERARRLVGRVPDKVFGIYGLYKIQLPSGVEMKPSETVDGTAKAIGQPRTPDTERRVSRLETALKQIYPGGVQQIAARDVVSDVLVQDYKILPREAGLLGLIKDGTLEVTGINSYNVVKKMRYPGGLTGANRVRFVLKKGVPQPEGNPGESCLFLEDSSQLIEGDFACWRALP